MKVYKEAHRKAFWATKKVFKTCCPDVVRLSEPLSERECLILPRLCLSELELA